MLSDLKIRTAKPRQKSYKLFDGFLLIAPSGGKLWRWNYSYLLPSARNASSCALWA
jgi:hypothetical protein